MRRAAIAGPEAGCTIAPARLVLNRVKEQRRRAPEAADHGPRIGGCSDERLSGRLGPKARRSLWHVEADLLWRV
jgi:hypothetical protein